MSSRQLLISLLALLQLSLGICRTRDDRPSSHSSQDVGVPATRGEGKFPASQHSPTGREGTHQTCTSLKNHGTHFTVELKVGTPSQTFDVVADTGSDAVIVPSCACVKAGYCDNQSRCFQGTNRSSTFFAKAFGLPVVRMRFGSGPVQAVVVTDVVGVGRVHSKMDQGVLLLTDHKLRLPGRFEGILGLGVPAGPNGSKKGLFQPGHAEQKPRFRNDFAAKEADTKHRTYGVGSEVNMFPINEDIAKPAQRKGLETSRTEHNTSTVLKSFAETAGVDRFSICFNDGKPGVMRLNTPPSKRPHGSLGRLHWGLGFHGISVGNHHSSVLFCDKTKHKSQKSPCGMIPDSGTTSILAPEEHLVWLYEGLCDAWPRCLQNFTTLENATKRVSNSVEHSYGYDPWGAHMHSKSFIFQQLIRDCKNWLQDDKQLDELPPLHFHVRGSSGSKQTIRLHGWSYIIQRHAKDFEYVYKDIPGVGKRPIDKKDTGETHLVCSPAFGVLNYFTEENGAVWIVGSPVFYEYTLGYDIKSNPPSISFHKCGGCGTCPEEASLVHTGVPEETRMSPRRCIMDTSLRFRPPRQVIGPWRVPTIDTKQSL